METPLNTEDLLFPAFLEDHEVYDQAEAWWRQLFRRLFTERDIAFRPFYTHHYGDGEKMYDANPIIDAYFPARHRLVRVIQYLPEPGDRPLSAWIDHLPTTELDDDQRPQPDDPQRRDEPVPELVLSLALTRATAAVAERLLERWIVEGVREEELGW